MIRQLVTEPDPEAERKRPPMFVPDLDLGRWVEDHFLNAESPLLIVDHYEIEDARIGFVWTNVYKGKGRRQTLGLAQMGAPTGDPWSAGAREQQLREWFGGRLPELLVTLYAPWCAKAPAPALLALIDHELCHFARRVNGEGEPAYDPKTERPLYELVGHDVEEFVAVRERWGDWDAGRRRYAAAGQLPPEMDFAEAERFVGPPLRL